MEDKSYLTLNQLSWLIRAELVLGFYYQADIYQQIYSKRVAASRQQIIYEN